ncbi:hypothetical protein [Hymenobacter armeniacus]|uniref:Uncharacterized protein n=1 Tax=Hymenobacter armeniacus TaxID=2771358 RepID=A0ABR8JPQ8_9BACT|nr:hypothetical protein [Hymenobacter armeniacus]MBD2721980.1 hypothetical protein [Hymenobacter armeniacus]
MLRNLFVLALLLGLFASADASAATAKRNPNRKIAPGNHRPIYRRYGHHGLFHNGFLGIHSKRQTKISGAKVGSKHRGTL